ncbi:MAG: thiamine phosphate synthase [Nitrospirae bacterium]|nr:thiamine phosphate synthase [Candidatus Troglogloeales bacterium]
MFPFYFITDPIFEEGFPLKAVTQAIAGGARLIQYRDKVNTRSVMYENAKRLREITAQAGATLIINDQIDLALAVGADGVHLGQNDLPISAARKISGKKARGGRPLIVGISTHTFDEAISAEIEGADYIGFGPIFKTKTKADLRLPTGISPIVQIKQKVKIPLVAIGGITQKDLLAIFDAGANGVAAISAVADDIESNVREWMKTIAEFGNILSVGMKEPRVP